MTKKTVTLAIGPTYTREATQTPNSHAGWPKSDRWLTGMGEFYESAGAWKITTGNFNGRRSWSLFYRGSDGKVEFIYLTDTEDTMLRKDGLKPTVRDIAKAAPAAPVVEGEPTTEPTTAEPEAPTELTAEPEQAPTAEPEAPTEPTTAEPEQAPTEPEPAAPAEPEAVAPAPEKRRGRRR